MKRSLRKILIEAGIDPRLIPSPWSKLKLLVAAASAEQQCVTMRTKIHALQAVVEKVDANEINETDAEKEFNQIMNPAQVRPSEQYIPVSTEGKLTDDQFNTDLAKTFVKKANHAVDQQEELVNRVQDAKTALALACDTWRKDTLDLLDEMDGFLLRLRQVRMATDAEIKKLLAGCGDVRQFFIVPEHIEEMRRLKEFVETMEKLQAMKNSGMLDAVSDTILKLATV